MLKNLHGNAKQITPDRELYKVVVEEGNKKNRLANLNDTCVGVFFIIKSGTENDSNSEIVDFTNKDDVTAWIVGDKESESSIYLFLQIGIRSMCEGETSKFYFTRKYLLGDAPIINIEGKILQADTFYAIVKLIKSTSLSQIHVKSEQNENKKPLLQLKHEEQPEKETDTKESNISDQVEKASISNEKENTKNENASNENKNVEDIDKTKEESSSTENKDTENINKTTENAKEPSPSNDKDILNEKNEAYQRRIFALNQLQIAESLLHQKKPAAARKEFNRARMSWSTQVDLSKAPESITHEALNFSEDELKKYVNSRALYGVSRTFLEIQPPNTEKAVLNLRESIELDPEFFEAKMMLESLGENVNETQFPQFEDKRLTKQQYWLSPDVEWSKREEYSSYLKEKATVLFKENNFKEALDLYKRCIISFSGQSKCKASLTKEQISSMNKVNIISKLNCLACYLSLKEYSKVVIHADELFDTISKMEPTIINENSTENCENYKLKCLYRKALAFIALSMSEKLEITILQMKDIKGSDAIIKAIRKKQLENEKISQKDQDAMFSKISMTLK